MDKDWIQYSKRPSLRSFLIRGIIKRGRIFNNGRTLQKTREMWESLAGKARIPSDFKVEGAAIAGINCEWVIPKESNGKKIVIYLHGGGYVLGNLATARGFALPLSRSTGEKVLSVDYRLAPENPFPAALEDSLAVYQELLKDKVNPKDIILVGDSAGGGLCLSTILALKDRNLPLPRAVVCISPWTDLAATGESNVKNAKLDPIFGNGSGVIRPEDYAGGESLYNPLISPLYGDYTDFPDMLIHVGTHEVILDDSMRLAEKAGASGVKVSLKIWKGMWHVFTAQERYIPEGKKSFNEIGAFIKELVD